MSGSRAMDEMLKEFLAESAEQIEAASAQIVAFERHPEDAGLIASIFRLVHTIKGTCGFLGLNRLQRLTHAAENLIGALREGADATPEVVSAVLAAVDRVKALLAELEEKGCEGEGDDSDMIALLEERVVECRGAAVEEEAPAAAPISEPEPEPERVVAAAPVAPEAETRQTPAAIGSVKNAHAGAPAAETAPGKRAETIRINLNTLERIMQLVSELVLTRNQLLEITRHHADETLKSPLQRLSAMTSDLQDAVMRARMQPVERVFTNLPRMIRDLATDLDKKINLVTDGGDTELDRQLIELIRDPLTHLVRNCADHGIEPPEERVRLGKPAAGTVRVAASHEAGQITIEISDDGRGLNKERIKEKALARGLATTQQLERMGDDEIHRFIFSPGFSTAERVTNVSGRGVGMDVVRENIQAIGGSVALSSTPGRGSCFALKIPLTLAIAPALIVEASGQRFALPQHSVVEAVGVNGGEHRIEFVQGSKILQLREAVLPIGSLAELLDLAPLDEPGADPEQLAVIMRVGAQSFGITVDAVTDVQEIVVKPMGGSLQHLAAFSGHTILGDGSVVLILDPNGLREALGLEQSREAATIDAENVRAASADKMRLIYFRAGAGVDKVLPLSNVARIETVSSENIELSNGMMLTHHQGRLMQIVAAAPDVMVKEGDNTVFVISPDGEPFGLLVDGILDIVDEKLDVEIAGEAPGIVGAANFGGKVVELLDIAYFIDMLRTPGEGEVKGKTRLLLVDDAAFFRDMLSATLQASGFEVVKAETGAQAVSRIAQNARFDAILIDVDLPDGAGFELGRRLRDAGARAPMIALAPFASREIMRAAEAAGMMAAVGKFQRNQLLDIIRACVADDGVGESAAFAAGVAA
ncbi:hybrid sensor histidine kinase/response regulator [Rhodoblastus acidophilus]|uniref:histidine kinase n=1 Tax=Candidatus Rhodoblastus alkanivorans TaxID=2954117 RepID=A0ABS9Z4B0_9HYPH|nr:hybrid sensor histidine kinase/response regulator [Candidatus Rhodoblastus alkanivorans]MCI4678816.1 hybrid sensor histidine kinase/response regulator [Candidatus Rhodoblastus alkanivorans]MCI4682205.1 hybrid sensor histidine kinase/response regulator [Candidatus Rhodoblastus alkanivorans]MDI4639507.1 hybrid sensor histidine kinase/response regulator [Rhodoblastus acidophilus]